MSSTLTLIQQRDKLAVALEDAIKKRNALKVIMSDPAELDRFLYSRVTAYKENIAALDITDNQFTTRYCEIQSSIGELNKLRASLREPDNNCKELTDAIKAINAKIDSAAQINKRELI